MRNILLAAAFLLCLPAWAQTSLPPQWGTSNNAAPTPKKKHGEQAEPSAAKSKVKLKAGKGTVSQPARESSQPAPEPAAPVAPPVPPPATPTAQPAPAQPAAPPVIATAPASESAPAQTKVAAEPAHHHRLRAAKAENPNYLIPAKAAPKPRRSAEKASAPAPINTPAVTNVAAPAPPAPAPPRAPVAATYSAPPVAAPAPPPPAAAYSSTPAPAVAPPPPAPAAAYSAPAPPVAPPPPPAVTYSAPAPPATSPSPPAAVTNYASPGYAAPQPASYVAPSASYPAPAATYAVPPPVAPPAPAPEPLPSLVAMSPRARRRAAAKAAAESTPSGVWMDISAPLSIGVTPNYPGIAPLQLRFDYDMERGAPLDLSEFSMSMHTCTHVDAPLQFVRGAPSIDQVPLDRFIGPALVLNIDPSVIAITAADLERYPWRGAKRILLRTRNSVNEWMVDPQFHSDYTFLAPDAAELLANNGVLLVGFDYLSIEQYGAPPRAQIILLSKGIPIVEGLDLRSVTEGQYDLTVLPLKILEHESAPARAILHRR